MTRLLFAALLALAAPAGAQTLTGAEWTVVTLQGGPLPRDVAPTIAFAEDGRFSGHSGCNRFMGGWSQDGLTLGFTQIAGTMMACDEAQMQVERRVFDAFATITGFAITPGGALELLGPEGLVIRATR